MARVSTEAPEDLPDGTPGASALPGTPPPGSLRGHRDFNHLWVGESLSVFCKEIGQLALPVVAVALLHATEFQIGVLNAASTAAFLLVGLPAGAWVDRWLKRRTMIAADLVRVVVALVVPVLWFTDSLAMLHLYVVAGVIGAASVFFDVSYQSYLPFLVRPDQVGAANSRLEGTAQVARIGGPALGGLLLKVVSAPALMISDAVGYLASAVALLRIKDQETPTQRADHDPLVTAVAEGLRFVLRHALLRPITLCTALSNLGSTVVNTLMPILLLRTLGFEPWVLGLVFSVGAVGGILGALTAARFARWVGEGTVIPVSAVVFGVPCVLLPLTIYAPNQAVAVAMLLVAEFLTSWCVLTYNVTQVSLRQRVCPPRLLGRMNASIRFLVWGVMPLGALASGALAAWIGVVPTLWVGTVIGLLASLPVIFSPLRGMRTLPVAPL